MTSGELNQLSKVYNLQPVEIMCIILWFATDNKTLAFTFTIGMLSKSNNKEVLAQRFFRKEETVKFITEQKNVFIGVDQENERRFDSNTIQENRNTKQQDSVMYDINQKTEISSDNIKELLEREYQKTTDPEKRTVLLIKIADFIGLKNNDQDDPLTPVIYLPERCQSCKFKQTTKE